MFDEGTGSLDIIRRTSNFKGLSDQRKNKADALVSNEEQLSAVSFARKLIADFSFSGRAALIFESYRKFRQEMHAVQSTRYAPDFVLDDSSDHTINIL